MDNIGIVNVNEVMDSYLSQKAQQISAIQDNSGSVPLELAWPKQLKEKIELLGLQAIHEEFNDGDWGLPHYCAIYYNRYNGVYIAMDVNLTNGSGEVAFESEELALENLDSEELESLGNMMIIKSDSFQSEICRRKIKYDKAMDRMDKLLK